MYLLYVNVSFKVHDGDRQMVVMTKKETPNCMSNYNRVQNLFLHIQRN